MSEDELRNAYINAEKIGHSTKEMDKIGCLMEACRDIILFKDKNGKFYYVSNKVWD